MRVLITSGGTREYIDDVRFISNISTGSTACVIAKTLAENNISVKMLCSVDAIKPEIDDIDLFETSFDLDQKLKDELGAHDYDFIIHMAAISDYTVDKTEGKLDSTQELSLKLIKNKKILPSLKGYSKNKDLKLIGFKLTSGADAEVVAQKVARVFNGGADFVVHNDLKKISKDSHPTSIYYGGEKILTGQSKQDLSDHLKDIILNRSL